MDRLTDFLTVFFVNNSVKEEQKSRVKKDNKDDKLVDVSKDTTISNEIDIPLKIEQKSEMVESTKISVKKKDTKNIKKETDKETETVKKETETETVKKETDKETETVKKEIETVKKETETVKKETETETVKKETEPINCSIKSLSSSLSSSNSNLFTKSSDNKNIETIFTQDSSSSIRQVNVTKNKSKSQKNSSRHSNKSDLFTNDESESNKNESESNKNESESDKNENESESGESESDESESYESESDKSESVKSESVKNKFKLKKYILKPYEFYKKNILISNEDKKDNLDIISNILYKLSLLKDISEIYSNHLYIFTDNDNRKMFKQMLLDNPYLYFTDFHVKQNIDRKIIKENDRIICIIDTDMLKGDFAKLNDFIDPKIHLVLLTLDSNIIELYDKLGSKRLLIHKQNKLKSMQKRFFKSTISKIDKYISFEDYYNKINDENIDIKYIILKENEIRYN